MVEQFTTDRRGWRSHLRGDPVSWLLEPANPSARYLTLRHVLRRPEGDPDVAEARAGILRAAPAALILSAQWPDGYWVTPDRGYTPRYRATVWQILFLAQLGAPRDERIERACEFVWGHSRRDDGLFTPHKRPRLSDLANLNGNLLWALAHFGYAGDPRVEQVLEGLAGLDLERLFSAGSIDSLVKLAKGLRALSVELPATLQSFLEDAIAFVASSLAQTGDKGRLRFGFPLAEQTDLLEMLALVQGADGSHASAVESVLDLVVQKQDEAGRWRLETVPGKMWASFGELGQANKWVTIRALRILRTFWEVM